MPGLEIPAFSPAFFPLANTLPDSQNMLESCFQPELKIHIL
jgi:hypothetical protein